MKLSSEERIAYMRAVWDTFRDKANTQRDMTNAEYHAVAKWLDADVPLFVVCRAIQDFEGVPKRLEALHHPVEKAIAYWRKSLAL